MTIIVIGIPNETAPVKWVEGSNLETYGCISNMFVAALHKKKTSAVAITTTRSRENPNYILDVSTL